MPGMMDTVLNIGLNDATASGMVALTGDERFVYDAYRRLVQMFGSMVMGIADEAFEQVLSDARRRAGHRNGTAGGDRDIPSRSRSGSAAAQGRAVSTTHGGCFSWDFGSTPMWRR